MVHVHLSRRQMARLLTILNGQKDEPLLTILKEAWTEHQKQGKNSPTFTDTELPVMLEKLIKKNGKEISGFSINEIVALGNLLFYTNLSQGAVQNWVKRDVKELIGSPMAGKKYTVSQAATLFIVEDLKHCLDFESIRHVLKLVFNNPEDRSDDLIDPVDFYSAYAEIVESLQYVRFPDGARLNLQIQGWIEQEAKTMAGALSGLSDEQKSRVQHVLAIAAFAAQTAYFQYAAKQVLHATYLM